MRLVCAHCGYSVEVGPGWYGEYSHIMGRHLKHDHIRTVYEDVVEDGEKTVMVKLNILGEKEEQMAKRFEHGPAVKCPVCGKYEVGLGYMIACEENVLSVDGTRLNTVSRWNVDYVCTDCMKKVRALLTSTDG